MSMQPPGAGDMELLRTGALIAATMTMGLVAGTFGLNDAIQAAGDPDHIGDLRAVRRRFSEIRWAAWNLVRALASVVAFGCLAWALVAHGALT
jgi:uncharacterized membrane protein